MASDIRILLLADSHLGFDLPVRARAGRRRRGHDFLANYRTALEPALSGDVDIVVHAGDVFDRPAVDVTLAYQALDPLARIAGTGVPVFIVAGNHERSSLPHHHLAQHPNVFVFERARTFVVDIRGTRVAISGFPFERTDVRTRFPGLLARAGWTRVAADFRLLCIHQCVEGATVGPADFMFRNAADVVRLRDIPSAFAAVLAGHIHRQQVLTHDLDRRPLATPVLYPGSIERTSYAEAGESKGFMIVRLAEVAGTLRTSWESRALPARPMLREVLSADGLTGHELDTAVRALVATAPADAVLNIRIAGDVTGADLSVLSAARLRTFVPATMNVEISADAWRGAVRRGGAAGRVATTGQDVAAVHARAARPDVTRGNPDANLQLDL